MPVYVCGGRHDGIAPKLRVESLPSARNPFRSARAKAGLAHGDELDAVDMIFDPPRRHTRQREISRDDLAFILLTARKASRRFHASTA